MDKEKICKCFQSLQNPNENIRKEAMDYLALCEQEKSFLPALFEIYKGSNDLIIQLNSIIYVHELIKHQLKAGRYMRRKKISKPKYNDEEIKFTRENVVKALLHEYKRPVREKLNQIVSILSKQDFPKHFSELFEYIKHVLGKISGGISNNTFKPDKEGLMTLKTIAECFKELQVQRRKFNPETYTQFSKEILKLFVPIWKKFEKSYLANMEIAAEYSLVLDEIFVYFLRLGPQKVMVEDPNYKECYKQIIKKSKEMVKNYMTMIQKDNYDEDIIEIIEKNITVITYQFVKNQKFSPISFLGLIDELMTYALEIMKIDWKRPSVPKNGMLMMFTTMNVFEYHTNPQNVKALSSVYTKMGIFSKRQVQCFNEFHKFFSENGKIEKIINTLLTKCMLLQEIDEEESEIEAAINNSVNLKLEKINQELDFTPRQVGLAIIDRFIRIMTTDTLMLVKKLVDNTINGNLDHLDISIRNNIISILNGLPRTLLATGMKNFKDIFDIKQILSWVNNNSGVDKRLLRRFPALLSSWYDILDESLKDELFKVLVNMLKVDDKVTLFHVLKAIGKFARMSNNENFDYGALLLAVTPKVYSILDQVKSSWLIFELIGVLNKLIAKLIKLERFDINIHLQCINTEILLKEYDFLIAGCLYDIIRDIICTFPFGKEMPELYIKAVKLIHKCLPNLGSSDDALLYFWNFIVKEIPNTEANKPVIDELVNLLSKNIKAFSNYEDLSQNEKVLKIIDETMLLQPKLPFDVLGYVKKKIEWSNKFKHKADMYRIRAASLTVYSTSIIISLQFKVFDMSNFDICFKVVLDNILNLERDLGVNGMISINTQSITLFNRFFMMNHEGMINFLTQNNINIEKFIETWVIGNSNLTAKKPLKISAITLLFAMDKFPIKIIARCFKEIMKITTREVFKFIDEVQGAGNNNEKKNRHRDRKKGFSHRKEELRNLQMFNKSNLLEAFQTAIKTFQNKLQESGVQAPNIANDEAGKVLQDNIIKLLNTNC